MEIEQLEQLAAILVTAGLVAGNFLMFTPWRDGEDPRREHPEILIPQHTKWHRAIGLEKEGSTLHSREPKSTSPELIDDTVHRMTRIKDQEDT